MIGDGAGPQRIYESTDGSQWRARRTNAAWGPRYPSADASFAGALWRVGGFEARGPQRSPFNDVWKSTDAARWYRVIAEAPWPPKAGAHLIPFRDSLWLIGGEPDDGNVWSTRDGVTWVPHRETGLPHASPSRLIAFQGALWILGHGRWEQATNDVWASLDGAHWRRVRSEAPWAARTYPVWASRRVACGCSPTLECVTFGGRPAGSSGCARSPIFPALHVPQTSRYPIATLSGSLEERRAVREAPASGMASTYCVEGDAVPRRARV